MDQIQKILVEAGHKDKAFGKGNGAYYADSHGTEISILPRKNLS